MIEWINAFLTYSIFIPSMWLCTIPVKNYLKWKIPFKKYIISSSLVILACSIAMAHVSLHNPTLTHPIFYFFMIGCAAYYLFSINLAKQILIYVFSLIVCMLSCATLLSYYWDAYRYPSGNADLINLETVLSQWGAVLILSVAFILLFWKKLEWLIKHYRSSRVWLYMTIPSLLITLCTIMLVPEKYENLYIGKVFSVSLLIAVTMIVLFFLINIVFYSLARISNDKAEAEQAKQLMELQLKQSELQSSYIDETHRLRHDFKHSIVVLSSLLQNGKVQDATDYLASYSGQLQSDSEYTEFCKLPALNALLNEYARQASENGIRFSHRIELPDSLDFDDPEFCILVGNLLNNAVEACKKIPENDRYIKMSFDSDQGNQLYLLVQNSYDGKAKCKGNYPENIPNGHYGIYSVKNIAENHRGVARFKTEGNVFYAEIMLDMK